MAESEHTNPPIPKARGRRTKLTPEVLQEIVECIEAGGTHKDAYETAGIGESTFYRWLDKGERTTKADNIFRQFWEDVKNAELEFKRRHVQNVENAALKPSTTKTTTVRQTSTGEIFTETKEEVKPPSWQASMRLLEAKFPEEYARRVVEHSGEIDTGDVETEVHFHFVDTGDKGATDEATEAQGSDETAEG